MLCAAFCAAFCAAADVDCKEHKWSIRCGTVKISYCRRHSMIHSKSNPVSQKKESTWSLTTFIKCFVWLLGPPILT